MNTDDTDRALPDSEIALFPPKPRNFRSLKLVLLMLALCAVFTGCSSNAADTDSVRTGVVPTTPSPTPTAQNYVAKGSGTSTRTGTSEHLKESDSLRWKLGTYVLNAYGKAEGISEPTRDDLDAIAGEICSDIRAGGEGKRYHPELVPSNEILIEFATALNYAYATSTECALSSDYTVGNNLRKAMIDLALNGDKLPAPDNPYYGGTVMCNDGTISNAGGSQGACSWHGGVND